MVQQAELPSMLASHVTLTHGPAAPLQHSSLQTYQESSRGCFRRQGPCTRVGQTQMTLLDSSYRPAELQPLWPFERQNYREKGEVDRNIFDLLFHSSSGFNNQSRVRPKPGPWRSIWVSPGVTTRMITLADIQLQHSYKLIITLDALSIKSLHFHNYYHLILQMMTEAQGDQVTCPKFT